MEKRAASGPFLIMITVIAESLTFHGTSSIQSLAALPVSVNFQSGDCRIKFIFSFFFYRSCLPFSLSPRSTSISTTATEAQLHNDDETPTQDDKRGTGLTFASLLGVYCPCPFFLFY